MKHSMTPGLMIVGAICVVILTAWGWRMSGATIAMIPALICIVIFWNIRLYRKISGLRNAVIKNEERYRDILDRLPVGIFRSSADGYFVDVNTTLAEMLGYSSREDLLTSVRDAAMDIYADPAERQYLLEALRLSNEKIQREIVTKRKDGKTFPIMVTASADKNSAGDVTYLEGAVEDISEWKKTEETLRRLAAAVEQSGEIILVTGASGTIQYVNQAFEKITGYSREETIGKNPRILKSGEHDRDFYTALWRTIASGKTWKGRIINRRKDGSLFTEDATISPVCDASGRVVNYVAAKRDVTHELALEAQYRQAQKMEAIGRLTGGVAHDFNNLLQAINGYTDLAVMDLPPESRPRKFLEKSAKVGQRAANLVQQLLLFSRRQAMQSKILNLNTVVSDMLKILERIIGEHIRIDWLPDKEPGIVNADSGMLDQVLMNLCVNARDAMPDGGVLTIKTQTIQMDTEFCAAHAWARSGRFVLISVSDTGCGMDPKTLDHIFEPFFTTKGEGKGTGLGLATSYGIVQQHNGMIDVDTVSGKGTTFRVYLPLCDQESDAVGASAEEPAAGGRETLLLAEDDDDVRHLTRTILEQAGYSVLTAKDGQEAIALFEHHRDATDALLLDIVMPGLGGHEVLTRIHAVCPDMPALFLSGYSESSVHADLVRHKKADIIQKPYTPNILLRGVRKILDA